MHVNHLQKLTYTQYPESIVCPPQSPSYTPLIALNLCRKPIYFTGNYLKLQRGLSQTPWCELRKELISRIVDGERKTEGSVEEDILGVLGEFIQSDGMKFHSAGREDVMSECYLKDVHLLWSLITHENVICQMKNSK